MSPRRGGIRGRFVAKEIGCASARFRPPSNAPVSRFILVHCERLLWYGKKKRRHGVVKFEIFLNMHHMPRPPYDIGRRDS